MVRRCFDGSILSSCSSIRVSSGPAGKAFGKPSEPYEFARHRIPGRAHFASTSGEVPPLEAEVSITVPAEPPVARLAKRDSACRAA